ncbi:MAG: DUF1499 domain-containing protein [Rhizobium sp.]|nr:DUF1499 domain-containing protein [Rhizobium sp.]
MTVRYERPVSRAAYLSRRLAIFSFLMFVAAWGMHRFGPLSTPSFLAVALAAALISAFAAYLAVIGIGALWYKGARGGKASAAALFFSIVPLAAFAYGAANYVNLPPIYDVSTDTAAPPDWLEVPSADQAWLGPRLPVTAANRQAQLAKWRDLTGRRYDGALDRVYTAARKVAIDQGLAIRLERGAPELALQELPETEAGREEAVPDALDYIPVPVPRPADTAPEDSVLPPGDPSIQGEQRTFAFGFRQDVVIRLKEELETTLVDVRVASRYGDRDLGAGVAYIESYLRALDAELLGIAGD